LGEGPITLPCETPHITETARPYAQQSAKKIGEVRLIHAEPSSSVSLAFSSTTTLMFFNSSLNPILYFRKIEEVRQAVKDKIKLDKYFAVD